MKKTFYLVSLGCAKNTVDSDSMANILIRSGYTGIDNPSKAEILIVNTCGFIEAARQESIQTLKDLSEHKKNNQLLIAAGCMTERYRQSISDHVDGINGFIGTKRWMDILEVINHIREQKTYIPYDHFPQSDTVGLDEKGAPRFTIQGGSAYLKIADGCRRPCAFCSIPLIKGTSVSRPLETIIHEARLLQEQGIQEINLISQDTTDYGSDLGLKNGLASLLKQLTLQTPAIPWLRLLYAYPGYVTDELIEVMAGSKQILHYLDIPLQHAHPDMLKRMKRPANIDWVYQTIGKMRLAMPDLAIRTTFIVGFPGETRSEYQSLEDFIKDMKFDHVGCFTYSHEMGTASALMADDVPAELKLERLENLMLIQENISLKNNQKLIGQRLPILVEGNNDEIVIGRSYRDAPEIDGMVFAEGNAEIGSITNVQITSAMTHDLMGKKDKLNPRLTATGWWFRRKSNRWSCCCSWRDWCIGGCWF
jgi:ribosomal protein S12 methylthiotransferase